MKQKCFAMMVLALGAGLVLRAEPRLAFAASDAGQPAVAQDDSPQVPQPADGGVNWKGVGVGAATMAGNVVYVPAKLVYGILGGIAGGFGYALTGGNKETADSIWRASLGGDYILTPDMIRGNKPIRFSGPSETGPQSGRETATGAPAVAANAAAPVPSVSGAAGGGGQPPGVAGEPIDPGAGPVGSDRSAGPAGSGSSRNALHGGLPGTTVE